MSLPQVESKEWQILVQEYPTSTRQQREQWAKQYHYPYVGALMARMRERGITLASTPVDGGWEPSEVNIPLAIKTTEEPKTMAVWNDFQIPFHDKQAVLLAEQLLSVVQPDYLVYNGDVFDFYQISRFDTNPARLGEMQNDINQVKLMLSRHNEMFPKTKKYWLDGNHEDRIQHFLWTKARELASLDCLSVEALFELGELGIHHLAYEQGLKVNDVFLILHGDIASVHSGYTAKRMFEKHGGCGICGHCHRGGSFYKRDRFGTWGWWENFCLCHLNPDWVKNPNWVQGFSLVHFQGDRFWVEQIPIIAGKLMYGGKVYD